MTLKEAIEDLCAPCWEVSGLSDATAHPDRAPILVLTSVAYPNFQWEVEAPGTWALWLADPEGALADVMRYVKAADLALSVKVSSGWYARVARAPLDYIPPELPPDERVRGWAVSYVRRAAVWVGVLRFQTFVLHFLLSRYTPPREAHTALAWALSDARAVLADLQEPTAG